MEGRLTRSRYPLAYLIKGLFGCNTNIANKNPCTFLIRKFAPAAR
jgi:hypothetical protein